MHTNRFDTTVFSVLCVLMFPLLTEATSLGALEHHCEEAREWHIAPLRQAAIEQCIHNRATGRSGSRSSRDAVTHCYRFYADFGQGGTTQSAGFRQRMFPDIPECQALYEAERAARRR